jgi:hypothetical protein
VVLGFAYATGDAMMFDRMKQNLIADGAPPVIINPHATAAIIKRGRDEGGWCGLSMKWARENGYALVGNGPGEWPLHSLNLKYDTNLLKFRARKRSTIRQDRQGFQGCLRQLTLCLHLHHGTNKLCSLRMSHKLDFVRMTS